MAITKGFNRQRRLVQGALVLSACTVLASCASLGGPRKVEVPLHKLQAGIERRFPLKNRVLEIFDIRLSRPMLSIQPEADRVALGLDVSVSPPFTHEAWSGSVAVSGRIYIDPGRPAVMMTEARVDRLTLGGNEEAGRHLASGMTTLINSIGGDTPVYTFEPSDLRYAGVQYIPTRIETTRSGLLVTLEPAK